MNQEPATYWLYFTVEGSGLNRYDALALENELNNSGIIIGAHVQPGSPTGKIWIQYLKEKIKEEKIVDLIRSKGIDVLTVSMAYDKKAPFKWLPFFSSYKSVPLAVPEKLIKYIGIIKSS